jgi:hypothetical protein
VSSTCCSIDDWHNDNRSKDDWPNDDWPNDDWPKVFCANDIWLNDSWPIDDWPMTISQIMFGLITTCKTIFGKKKKQLAK